MGKKILFVYLAISTCNHGSQNIVQDIKFECLPSIKQICIRQHRNIKTTEISIICSFSSSDHNSSLPVHIVFHQDLEGLCTDEPYCHAWKYTKQTQILQTWKTQISVIHFIFLKKKTFTHKSKAWITISNRTWFFTLSNLSSRFGHGHLL